MNPGENPRRASLLAALDEADRALKRLPLTDPRRGDLARRIVQIEAAIDADMGGRSMTGKYILDGHEPVACDDLMQWGGWFESAGDKRVVARTGVGDLSVSTVFLALDHRFGKLGPPLLFETMIFAPDGHALDGWQERCSTWEQAEAQHAEAVKLAESEAT